MKFVSEDEYHQNVDNSVSGNIQDKMDKIDEDDHWRAPELQNL